MKAGIESELDAIIGVTTAFERLDDAWMRGETRGLFGEGVAQT